DAAIDYREAGSRISKKIREACPEGVDAYFDNVGGPITDAVFPSFNVGARVAICGQISQYNNSSVELGPRLLGHFIVKRIRMQGFLVFDFKRQFPGAFRELSAWVAEGKLTFRENFVDGIENAPDAFLGLFRGDNIGKQLVRVSD
ncbi:MAG: zinc-binding dehydrogenase, partial [Planctomycetota bacterium]